MGAFCSFLVFRPEEASLVDALCAQSGWSVSWITDPSKRFRFSPSGVARISKPWALKERAELNNGETFGRLLLVNGTQSLANNITRLIGAAGTILAGFHDSQGWPSHALEITREDPKEQSKFFEAVFQTSGYFEVFINDDQLITAVALASRAWGDRKLVYAIHKLAESYRTECVTPWSMHPRHGGIFEKHSDEFGDHVTTSVAINLAFSAIEELGLDVRSSAQKPRWVDKEAYEWNPEVLRDIEARLEKAGVDPSSTIDWVSR